MKLVSIIVTNYNGKNYLTACFNALLKQTYTAIEIILSDDASTDGSVEFVRQNFPQIKISVNAINSGLSVTSNNGASLAKGEYLFFFNNDTVAFPDLVANLVSAIEGNPDAAVAYPAQLPYDSKLDPEWYNSRKKGFSACGADMYGNPCPALSEDKVFYPDAAIFIKRNVFDEIGRFDPAFFLYGEDIDICWRVHLMGYRIVYVDNARFRHDSGCTQIENNRVVTNIRRRALVERQVINMMLKYYRLKTLLLLLPRFFVMFSAEAFFFLIVKLNYKMFRQVYLQAIIWNIKNWPNTFLKRSEIQKIRRADDDSVMQRMYRGYSKLGAVKRMGIPVVR
jgi:GT2 family glycosyltransferase